MVRRRLSPTHNLQSTRPRRAHVSRFAFTDSRPFTRYNRDVAESSDSTSTRTNRLRLWLGLLPWLLVLTICVNAFDYRRRALRQYESASIAWSRSWSSRYVAAGKLRDKAGTLLGQSHRDVQAALSGRHPFRVAKPDPGSDPQLVFDDSISQSHLWLTFQNDYLSGVAVTIPRHPPPPPHWLAIEHLRQFLAGYGILFWVVLFGLSIVLPRYRRPLANLLLAFTVLVIAAYLLGPRGPVSIPVGLILPSTGGIEQSGAWYWLIIMAITSLALSIILHVKRPRLGDTPLCPWCAYNLTGNQSGRCPECGRKIPLSTRWLLHQPPPPDAALQVQALEQPLTDEPEMEVDDDERPPQPEPDAHADTHADAQSDVAQLKWHRHSEVAHADVAHSDAQFDVARAPSPVSLQPQEELPI